MPGIREGEVVQLGPWKGGVRYDKPTENILEDELGRSVNCRVGVAGQVEKRLGSASYKSQAAMVSGSDEYLKTVTGCGQFVNTTSVTITFMMVGNKYFEYDSGWQDRTNSVTISQPTSSVDSVFEWVNANGTLYAVNGTDVGIKTRGGAITDDAPTHLSVFTMPSTIVKAKHIAFWDNRLWIGNVATSGGTLVDRVYRSEAGVYETWEASYNVGGPVTALVAQENGLTIHTEDGIWVLTPTGTANTPYSIQPKTQQGGLGGRSTIMLPNGTQMMVRKDGIYSWDGGEALEKKSQALDSGYWSKTRTDRLGSSFAVYHPIENEVWFFLCDNSEDADNVKMNSVIIYNIIDDFWFGPYTGWSLDSGALIDNKPHGGDFAAKTLDLATGGTDEGSAIPAFFQTSGHTDDDPTRKRWIYARLYFDVEGDHSVLVRQWSSGLVGNEESVEMGTGAGSLGTDVLGAFTLGAGFPDKPVVVYGDVRLHGYDNHTSLGIENTGSNEAFTFRNIQLAYKPLGLKRKRRIGVE